MTQTDATSEATEQLGNEEVSSTTEVPITPKEPKKRIRTAKAPEGPKRHLKKVKDSLASIRKPSLKRLGRRAGIRRFTSNFYIQARKELQDQLKVFMKECFLITEMNKKKTINNECVRYVFRKMGRPLYVSHH